MARETWTDERLDDLKVGIDQRFDRVEATMKEGFAQAKAATDERFERVDADLRELRQAVSQMHRTVSIGFIGLASLIVSAQIFL